MDVLRGTGKGQTRLYVAVGVRTTGGRGRKKKTRRGSRRVEKSQNRESGARRPLLLPRTLLVAIRLQALPALVLVHLQTTFLFQVAHVSVVYRAVRLRRCKAEFTPLEFAPDGAGK